MRLGIDRERCKGNCRGALGKSLGVSSVLEWLHTSDDVLVIITCLEQSHFLTCERDESAEEALHSDRANTPSSLVHDRAVRAKT